MRSDPGTGSNADFVLLRELVGLVLTQPTLSDALQRAAELIAADVPGADDVSVTFADGQPRTIAFSGELALRADEYQYDVDSGPCLAAMRGGKQILVEDLESDHRWPDYAPRALAEGVRSSLSLPLFSADKPIGALNIYSRVPNAFDESVQARAEEIADYAGVVLSNAELYYSAAQRAEQMREAMESRAVIEQAKGVLMARERCDADAAFFLLVRMSQTGHRKLREVAASVVADITNA